MKVIKDFKAYLDEIDRLSKKLPLDKKKQLQNIISVMLTLLICMKRDSNLGVIKFEWED